MTRTTLSAQIHEVISFTIESDRQSVRDYFLVGENNPVRHMETIFKGLDANPLLKISGLLGNERAKREWNRLQGPNGKERLD